MVEQYEVYWVELDPTRGGEMAKTRPCVVVTPSDLNMYLTTVVIVPITSTIRNYPYRVLCSVAGREGEIATDQIRLPEHSERRFLIAEIFHFLLYIKDNFSFLRCGLLFPSILI